MRELTQSTFNVSAPAAAALLAEIELSTGAARSLGRLVALMRAEMDDPEGLLHEPLLAGRVWHAVLSGLLVATADRCGDDHLEPANRPRTVKRAIDAMRAEPDRPFTADSLAAIAGTSVRTLQESFRQHVGVPPMAYLRRLRLARAHADLLAAEPGEETVASVAHRWGFAHLGRFAAAYRARYGRSPADTLHGSPPRAPSGPDATTPARADAATSRPGRGRGATLPGRRAAAAPSSAPGHR